MIVAVTGATGFLGRYIVNKLLEEGHRCRCWYRPQSDRGGFLDGPIEWTEGELDDEQSAKSLVRGADAVVHAALDWGGSKGKAVETFARRNVMGTIRLFEAARASNAGRFIFISTCSVHDIVLDDRPLDEAHPLWPKSHYGAHKAAIEKFVHSFGLGVGYNVCSLRPTGIYGLACPIEKSKWYSLVRAVAAGEDVHSAAGGKEVHAADVAKAVKVLLEADGTAGQAYNCYDMYIADQDVAQIAKDITGSRSAIEIQNKGPKNQIATEKLRALGMKFGGNALLKATIQQMVDHQE